MTEKYQRFCSHMGGRWWPAFLNCLRIHVGLNKPTKRKQLAWLRDALKGLADSLILPLLQFFLITDF
jgi:hypothetical protein